MAERNMIETIKAIETIPEDYDLSLMELVKLRNMAEANVVDTLYGAFTYGFALGSRCEKERGVAHK